MRTNFRTLTDELKNNIKEKKYNYEELKQVYENLKYNYNRENKLYCMMFPTVSITFFLFFLLVILKTRETMTIIIFIIFMTIVGFILAYHYYFDLIKKIREFDKLIEDYYPEYSGEFRLRRKNE